MPMAFDRAAVKTWLKITRDEDDAILDLIVASVLSYVDELPDIRRVVIDELTGATAWADSTVAGALLLAGRLYRRRNSPAGVEAMTDTGVAYVARTDPDVARLLRIENNAPPRVG